MRMAVRIAGAKHDGRNAELTGRGDRVGRIDELDGIIGLIKNDPAGLFCLLDQTAVFRDLPRGQIRAQEHGLAGPS